MSFIFELASSTISGYLEETQEIMFEWAESRITLGTVDSRLQTSKWVTNYLISLVVDCKEQGCLTSSHPAIEDSLHSGKYKMATVSFLCGCDPTTGKVLFLSKSFVGSKNDQNIFDSVDWDRLLAKEFILSDKGFAGRFIVKKHSASGDFELSEIQIQENNEIDATRIIIENVFGWCSIKFAICGLKWRTKTSCGAEGVERLLRRHNMVWTIVMGIYNEFSSVRK